MVEATSSYPLSLWDSRQCHIIISWQCRQPQYSPLQQFCSPSWYSLAPILLFFRHGSAVIQQRQYSRYAFGQRSGGITSYIRINVHPFSLVRLPFGHDTKHSPFAHSNHWCRVGRSSSQGRNLSLSYEYSRAKDLESSSFFFFGLKTKRTTD